MYQFQQSADSFPSMACTSVEGHDDDIHEEASHASAGHVVKMA